MITKVIAVSSANLERSAQIICYHQYYKTRYGATAAYTDHVYLPNVMSPPSLRLYGLHPSLQPSYDHHMAPVHSK